MKLFVMLTVFAAATAQQDMKPVGVRNRWSGGDPGFQGYMTLHVDEAIGGWQARLVFDKPIDRLSVWEGQIISNIGNKEYLIGPVDYDRALGAGRELQVWFNAYGDENVGAKYSFETFKPTTTASTTTINYWTSRPPTTTQSPFQTTTTGTATSGNSITKVPSATFDYNEALRLSILFYDAQRSGKLPANNPINWRGDSAVTDGDAGHDLSGGWYDGGDHVKFNFPMSYSTWVLAWGMLRFKDGYTAAGQLNQACDMIRWPLEYFLKCWIPEDDTLYVQVGEVHKDHAYWGRPEDMTMERKAFKVTPSCKGSDVSAGTASALASGSIVFRTLCSDPAFADKLVKSAKSLYDFAKNNRGLYSDCVKEDRDYYKSDGDEDDLSAAAAWLYKATQNGRYLIDAMKFFPTAQPWDFSWNDVSAAAALLLYEETQSSKFKDVIVAFVGSYQPNGTVLHTPCGMAWLDQWGPNRYAANAALIALMAAKTGIQPDNYKTWANSQINNLLGDNKNNISYEIGYQNNYPKNPHHRGSSCSTTSTTCNIQDSGNNPNPLMGALVGGPDVNGGFKDSRNNNVQNEVACDFNAGFQSALAGLQHFAHNNDLPPAPASKC